jgi:hypothetical protein
MEAPSALEAVLAELQAGLVPPYLRARPAGGYRVSAAWLAEQLSVLLGPAGWSLSLRQEGSLPAAPERVVVWCRLELAGAAREALCDAPDLEQAVEGALAYSLSLFGLVMELPRSEPDLSETARQHIDRLLEQLRQAGLGLEAARITLRHRGYGDSLEESRQLYSELRGLLRDRIP